MTLNAIIANFQTFKIVDLLDIIIIAFLIYQLLGIINRTRAGQLAKGALLVMVVYLVANTEIPSHRFNAGEKVLFWAGVFGMGLVVVVSGLVLDKLVPNLVYERGTMQLAHMVHAVAAILMMGLFMGHIYMGTLGVRGAYGAMRTGYVDETWAKEHHQLWYDDIKAGKIAAQRSQGSAQAADAPGSVPLRA